MSRRWPTIVAGVAVAFGLVLRWWRLGHASLWFDEGYTAWVVSLPPAELVAAIRVDTAPPVYYLLLHAWTAVAGTGEAALRVPSAVCSTVSLGVMLGVIGRLFRDPWARAAAVTLVAVSFMQVAYAHEARFYAAVSLAGAVDLYLVLRACDGERRHVGWMAAVAAAWAASLWLNNIMAIYLACLGLTWLAVPGRRPVAERVVDAAIVAGAAVAAFLPWVATLAAQARAVQANYWSHPPTGHDLVTLLVGMAGVAYGGFCTPVVLAASGAGAAVAWRPRATWRTAATAVGFGLLPVLVTFAYSHVRQSIFMDRALIVSSAVVPLLAAVPLEATAGRSGRWRAGPAVVAGLLTCGSVHWAVVNRFHTGDHDEDWRAACRYAADRPTAGRLLVFNANEGELLFDYYARGGDYTAGPDRTGTPTGYFDVRPPRTMRRVRGDDGTDALRRTLDATRPTTVVFVDAHGGFADADGRTLAVLRGRLRPTACRAFAGVVVWTFAGR